MSGPGPSLAERMAEAARVLQDEADPQATMSAAAKLAVSNVDGCDAAAISVVRRGGRLETQAYTDDLALDGDMLQYALGEGPCLDAAWKERVVHSADLESESRWPTWAARIARDRGARSILCLQLFTRADSMGALNLYSRTPGAFGARDRDDGLALAAHVAIAIAASQQVSQLAEAVDTRAVIGQACGILMERFDMDATTAFHALARISSESNVKLREVAHELVRTRHLPRRS